MWFSRIIGLVLISVFIVLAARRKKNTRTDLAPDFSVVAQPSHAKNIASNLGSFVEDDGGDNDDGDYIDGNDNSNYYGGRKKKTAAANPKKNRKGRRDSNMDNMDDHHQPSIAQAGRKTRHNDGFVGGYVRPAVSKAIHKIRDWEEGITENGHRVPHLPRRSHLPRMTSHQDADVAHGRSGENARINQLALDEQASPHATPIAKHKGKTKGKGKKKNTLVGLERQDGSMAFPVQSIYKNKGDQTLHD